MQKPVIYWLRKDLRLYDNPALVAAAQSKAPVIFLYILDETKHKWSMGAASSWWLHKSLENLSETLKKTYDAKLILRKGAVLPILEEIIAKEDVTELYFNRCYEPHELKQDREVEKTLSQVRVNIYNSALLRDPWEYQTSLKKPYQVFTPFWNLCQKLPVRDALSQPKKINVYKTLHSNALEDLKLIPKIKWYQQIEETFQPGEKSAQKRLRDFLKDVKNYKEDRDVPSLNSTSRLSPHLHFGEISPVQIWHDAYDLNDGANHFLSELVWREFSYHLLYYFPKLPDKPFKQKYAKFPWQKDKRLLKKWQKGQTGIPLVDAGMLELWHTGYMHNRVRMVTASFLIKNLLQPWVDGEAWFFDTLVDADLANNSASWQWVFGSGADAAPFFRIFNPTLQGQKFDPQGLYVKTWLPVLKNLPDKYIHNPWQAPKAVLDKAGVFLGKNYPHPIVDLGLSRTLALEAFKNLG